MTTSDAALGGFVFFVAGDGVLSPSPPYGFERLSPAPDALLRENGFAEGCPEIER